MVSAVEQVLVELRPYCLTLLCQLCWGLYTSVYAGPTTASGVLSIISSDCGCALDSLFLLSSSSLCWLCFFVPESERSSHLRTDLGEALVDPSIAQTIWEHLCPGTLTRAASQRLQLALRTVCHRTQSVHWQEGVYQYIISPHAHRIDTSPPPSFLAGTKSFQTRVREHPVSKMISSTGCPSTAPERATSSRPLCAFPPAFLELRRGRCLDTV